MPSALAAQLAASTSLNASLLTDRSTKRHTESYLFTGRDADLPDLDALHALASFAFSQLRSLSPAFASQSARVGADGTRVPVKFEHSLFSDAAKTLDRTLQTPDFNASLDQTINAFLALLGPWLMEPPSSKVLEWLVRRFRINEFNVSAVLALFLPYHESPHFVKMLSILHIQLNSPFAFLLPFKSAAKPVARGTLVKAMMANTELARFVASLVPDAVKCSHSHRTLLAFHVATMNDYISSSQSLDEGTLAFILPSFLTPLQSSQRDLNLMLGSFFLLCTLSQRVNLKPAAISVIISAMATQARAIQNATKDRSITTHFLKSAVVVCSSQEIVPEFPLNASQICIKLSAFADEVSKMLEVIGVHHFVLPLIQSLRERVYENRVSALFSALINAPNTPSVVVKGLARILVELAALPRDTELESDVAETRKKIVDAARSLLSLVHQRHLELLRDIANDVLSDAGVKAGEVNEDKKERKKMTNELLTSFSLTHPLAESSNINEMVVASASTSKDARGVAVGKMYAVLQSTQNTLSTPDLASIQSALLGRIYDTHAGVLQALYASSEAFLSTVASTTPPQQLLDIITSQLTPMPPTRAVLRAHVAFLSGPFVKANPNLTSTVQQTALFPFLLASKAKFKTARSVWEAVRDSDSFGSGWLQGCVDMWDQASLLGKDDMEADKDDGDDGTQKICEVNLAVASKIAENILNADDSNQDITVLLSKLHDPASHARALAYLVCRALLTQTSGNQQILLAHRLIRAMRPILLEASDDLSLEQASDVHQVAMKVVAKPGGRHTTCALQASILALISTLAGPPKVSAAWVSVIPSAEQISSDPSQCYVSLMQEIYALASAHAGNAPTSLSMSVLQRLFLSLRDGSLAFLLGILLASSPSLEGVRTHALLHVLAFVRGHAGASTIDFQTVVPSLIAILVDPRSDKRDRALILQSISFLDSTSEKKHMYGLDTVYGPASSQLQYVDTNDLSVYIKALVNVRDQVIQDAAYVQVFHQDHFGKTSTKYRRRVLCFLLSHIISHPLPSARIALLRSIEGVTEFTKSQMLLPVMKEVTQDPGSISQTFEGSAKTYTSLVVAGFLTVPPAALQNREYSEFWPTFLSGLRVYFRANSDTSARDLYANALEERIFAHLSMDKQSEICALLLESAAEGGETYLASRALVGKLIIENVPLIIRLLFRFRPDRVESEAPVNKRAKLDQAPQEFEVHKLQALSSLAEVLGTMEIPGSLDLMTTLLETLNRIVRFDPWGPSDTGYTCQMLMAAIDKSASKVQDSPTRSMRLDVLVELIRVTDNPQTFHEALLLIAKLARLTPDSVLHNIMPIFTFMGSNVLHRDDSYSFKVVQSTIDSIVPVMVSSLKTKHLTGLDLYVGARDFLRIFTDASNHIPRHRRQNFFVHLTQVLGAQAFLAPVCMLLIDKVTNRASRQTPEEAQNTLSLPTSLLRHFDRPRQLFVLTEVLKECIRLRYQLMASDTAGPAFLDYPRDGEHSSSTSATLKRRIQALVMFASTSLAPSEPDAINSDDGGNTTDVMTHLLDLATPPAGQAPNDDAVAIVTVSQTAIERIMTVISAREFLDAGRTMLTINDTRIKEGALGVLCSRIPLVTHTLRQECQATMIQVIELVRGIIECQSAGSLIESALAALKTLGSTCCQGEEVALLSTLPHILKVVRTRTCAAAAVSVLPYYVTALGPRIIPHFKDVTQECISILREGLKGKTPLANAGEAALATLDSLLSSLPAFYGANELTELAKLYVDYSTTSTAQNNPLAGLSKAISKRVSAEVLLPVLCELWPNVNKAQTKHDVNAMIGYFVLLKRALHAAPRPEVSDSLRPIFKVFVEAFDVKMVHGLTEGKPHVISAFIELVVKLNESTFRPLFRRLHDWAFADEKGTDERRVTFCHVYTALLDYFKGLMNPYMSMLLRPLTEALQSFGSSGRTAPTDLVLWSGVMGVLTKSLEADDGVFWREDKLAALLPHMMRQVPVAGPSSPPPSISGAPSSETEPKTPRQLLMSCLLAVTALLPNTSSDLLKHLNLGLLMHTRSQDVRVCLLALECTTAIWKAEGGKLIGFVGETATFIAECAEDENDSVVREAHQLKDAVESVAGNIGGL